MPLPLDILPQAIRRSLLPTVSPLQLAAHAYAGSSPLKKAKIIDSDFVFSWDKIIVKILLSDSVRLDRNM